MPSQTMPFSAEAETAVIGGLLLNNEAWDDIGGFLSAEDFYNRDHHEIYVAMREMVERGEPLDIITLSESLKTRLSSAQPPGKADAVLARLARCADETPSAENATFYARIVHEHAMRRRLIIATARIMEQARDGEEETVDLLDKAEQQIFEIGDQTAKISDFRSMTELSVDTIKQAETMRKSGSGITGLSTGYKDFDKQTGGLQKGDLLILAGRPSMGKTAWALNVAERIALKGDDGPVVIFSMEMPMTQISQRICASMGRVNQLRLRTGSLHAEEWPRLTQAVDILKNGKNQIYIDDTPALRPDTLRAKARRFKRKYGLSLIVIDYLQLMRPTRNAENRNIEITQISYALKSLARELNVPLVVVSQLNRNLEQRTNKRPIMSDLRESGSLEQDADLIIFIYRDEVYNEDTEDKGVAEIHVAKQRNGPQFTTKLTFLGEYTRFEDRITRIHEEEYGGIPAPGTNDEYAPF